MSENDSHPSQNDKQGSQTANRHGPEKPTDEQEAATPFTKWPWPAQFAFALFILVAVTTLLVGLPVASMLIVERMSPGSLVGTVSFWGASFTAFISLAVVFIASVFAFTALKVEECGTTTLMVENNGHAPPPGLGVSKEAKRIPARRRRHG